MSAIGVRALAFYLPQYHPTAENDAWWGTGFTEWRNVSQARPLFRGHHQPHVPADLGFYDLRLPETRAAQAQLARDHGITGFCYYHYWFAGRRVLDRPFREVLASGEPDFPFCLCWANEDWTRAWDGRSGERLLLQEYSEDDDRRHIRSLLAAFADRRYLRVDGKPLFLVYRANRLPDANRTTDVWREEAAAGGIGDLYLCRVDADDNRGDPIALGFDAGVDFQPAFARLGQPLRRRLPVRAIRRLHGSRSPYRKHRIFDYRAVVDDMLARDPVPYRRFPCVTPGWDNTPRRERNGVVLRESSPAEYERWLRAVVEEFEPFGPDENLVFLNAWNEWAEGNHLEPCRRWGRGYLEATARVLGSSATASGAAEGPDDRTFPVGTQVRPPDVKP
jgi:lipopolysaccharide biosynthesis protein